MGSETGFRIVLAAIFLGFVLHRGYYHRKMAALEPETVEEPPESRLSRLAGLLSLPGLLGVGTYLINPAWMSWSGLALPDWIRWLGAGVALGGFGLLQWSQNALGKSWSGDPRMLERQRLVRVGPYRRIRHPIYTSFLLILGSPLLIAANWFIGGFWIAMVSLDVYGRIRLEEGLMLAHFGEEYTDYMQSTGRLLPRL